MPDQRDVQQLIQSLTPSAVNNGNPNTVYNQPMPQGGYIPPTFDPGTNTWRVNPAPAAPTVNWQQMAMSQPQSWNWAQPTPAPTPVPPNPGVPGPTTPVPTTPVQPPVGTNTPGTPGTVNRPQRTGDLGVGSPDEAGGCVVIDSFLTDYDRADDVQVGDEMSVVDPVKRTTSFGKVSYSETKLMPCVRITTEAGIVLDCSTTAPIADGLGNQVLAPDLLNKLIPVVDNGAHYLDRVASIEDIGEKEVRHITVENNFFLAGKEKGRYIYHHNIKFDGNKIDLFAMMDSLNNQFGWTTNSGGFGAESMGGGAPNTRGAMQANGTWDKAHGGTASNPATAWGAAQQGGSNYTPTGQGLVDAFGGSLLPSGNTTTAPNPWAQATPVDSWNPDMSWMTPSPVDFSGYGPQLNAPPQLQVGQQSGGSWLDSLKHWGSIAADAVLPGNNYLQEEQDWLGNSAGWAVGDTVLGLGGAGYNLYERQAAQDALSGSRDGAAGEWVSRASYEYRQQATPAQQQAYVNRVAAQTGTTPEAILQLIGR